MAAHHDEPEPGVLKAERGMMNLERSDERRARTDSSERSAMSFEHGVTRPSAA
jgi:hypothetical protein